MVSIEQKNDSTGDVGEGISPRSRHEQSTDYQLARVGKKAVLRVFHASASLIFFR